MCTRHIVSEHLTILVWLKLLGKLRTTSTRVQLQKAYGYYSYQLNTCRLRILPAPCRLLDLAIPVTTLQSQLSALGWTVDCDTTTTTCSRRLVVHAVSLSLLELEARIYMYVYVQCTYIATLP